KLIQELDAFAHTVAHDLKTPLGVVIGAGEILQDFESLTHDQLQEISTLINRNGSKMNDIIKELLLLAQVRKGLNIVLYPLKMAEIVAEAQQRLAHVVDELQAELILPDTWPVVYGYGPWIEEVWYNYLSNALKYGGRPPRIELGASPSANGYTRFWIKDNGSGITPDMQDKLFSRTLQSERMSHNGGYRVDEYCLDGYRPNGHGLGLSIVRRIVERFKGEVEVESDVGQGSTFSFTLPNTA
ncbi:MAG: HAMP domain-containing sensor histidine kinase, partial [Anaerolineae bacterium]|nr:HAMP domain-containing sensor histidine kinase [Anaerolineae bacterium]